jgi:TPR repeat protein
MSKESLSLEDLKLQAEKGNIEAQMELGEIFYRKKDYNEAFKWMSLATD